MEDAQRIKQLLCCQIRHKNFGQSKKLPSEAVIQDHRSIREIPKHAIHVAC